MKIVYIGIPNSYLDHIDAIAAVARQLPGVTVKTVSVYMLAERDISAFVDSPPPSEVHSWIEVRRRFDSGYWIRAFSDWVNSAIRFNTTPYLVILFVNPEAEKAIEFMLDAHYTGVLQEVKDTVNKRIGPHVEVNAS